MSSFHAAVVGIVGLLAILLVKMTDWFSMPDVISISPMQVVGGLLLVLIAIIGIRIL